ncbi:unnamed protein product [Diamesa serratosioi]
MPKRVKTKSSARKKKSGNETERLAEVYIQEERNNSSSSNTDSSSSSDSSDSDYLRKVKKLRRKDQNAKKYYKKIRRQMDTFQRNIDIKLNYMEIILQNILKAQNSQDPIENLPLSTAKKPKLPIHVQAIHPETKLLPEPSSHKQQSSPIIRKKFIPTTTSEKIHIYKQSLMIDPSTIIVKSDDRDIPDFPITDIDELVDFDQMLQEDNAFVKRLIQSLMPKAKPSRGSNSQVSRAIQLMYFLFDVSLLAAFSFTGKTRSKEIDGKMYPKKNTFSGFKGIIELVRSTVNMSDEENITDKDLIVAIQIALKRAPDKRDGRNGRKPWKITIDKLENVQDDNAYEEVINEFVEDDTIDFEEKNSKDFPKNLFVDVN